MKILLVGGGSGGSVSPLLAVVEEIKRIRPKTQFLLIGTKAGPEKDMSLDAKIPFKSIPAGKLRRYFSLRNLTIPFLSLAGFVESLRILKEYKPNIVFGTGSFVQVPVVWAAWFLKIPALLHQQDIIPSLANRLCEIPAKKITVTFEQSLSDFSSDLGIFYRKNKKQKVVLTGNPFRSNMLTTTKAQAQKYFQLKEDLPTLLVLGGGTGAAFLNDLVLKSLPQLTKSVQIIHSTGKTKQNNINTFDNYHEFEFINEMGMAYAAADIVLCRAGLSTITELCALKKLSIVVPMPDSHQEYNAWLLTQTQSAIVLFQEGLSSAKLVALIRRLLFEHQLSNRLIKNISEIMPRDSAKKIAQILLKEALD